MALSMCRVCLVGNSRMLNIDNSHLLDMFEKLTNTKLNAEVDNRMPSTICYVCHRQLQKCHSFSNMAQKSNKILVELLHDTYEESHTTLMMPSQEIMHHLVVTPTQQMSLNIGSNTSSISPVTITEKQATVILVEDTANKDFGDVTLKFERLDEDIESCNDLTQHKFINICPNPASIFPVTVKDEQVDVKEETVKIENDDDVLKLETPDENVKNYSNNTEPSQKKHNDVKTSSLHSCFYCDVCNKKFYNKYLLLKHLKVHMRILTGEKPHSCIICNKAFTQKGRLTCHMRVHTGEKPYSCNRCVKAFTQRSHLTSHMRVHTGEKPYSCNRCGKAFTQISNLKSHMRVHTKEKPYSCNRCDKAFSQIISLTNHMRRHNGEKPYPCKRCDKSFTGKSYLTSHMRVHTGEKPYTCNMCDMAFTQMSNLKRHIRVHTGEKPYSCNRCDMTFTQRRNLSNHIRRVHTKEKNDSRNIPG